MINLRNFPLDINCGLKRQLAGLLLPIALHNNNEVFEFGPN